MKTKKQLGIAAKAIVYKRGKYLLLYKNSTEDIAPNTVDIPGGRVESEENLEEALVREVWEETGLKVKVEGLISRWSFIGKDTNFLKGFTFFCFDKVGKLRLSKEHTHAIWLPAGAILSNPQFPDWLKETIIKAEKFRSSTI